MTKRQEEYIFERISGPLNQLKRRMTKKYTTPGVSLSTTEKLDLIFSKKPPPMRPRDAIDNQYSRYPEDCYDFSAIEKDKFVDEKAIKRKMAPYEMKAITMRDTIMLGDLARAMKMIAE